METLSQLLSSRTRAEVFTHLFGLDPCELHIREITRRAALSEASVRQELKKLEKMGLVRSRRDSNRLYYHALREHPLYMDIHRIVLKTTGLVEVLRNALGGIRLDAAFVFGSVAAGEESATSDVDLMILGDVGLRTVSSLLTGASEKIGREINPHLMSTEEYKRRRDSGDHFAVNVIGGPRLFIVGNIDEFESMGG
jgi:uncharacterized protein